MLDSHSSAAVDKHRICLQYDAIRPHFDHAYAAWNGALAAAWHDALAAVWALHHAAWHDAAWHDAAWHAAWHDALAAAWAFHHVSIT